MFKVTITKPADDDIQSNYEWWRENRSKAQAEKWYDQIFKKLATLSHMPHRCPRSPESNKTGRSIHQMLFGTGRPTHRIVFVIKDQMVVVLRVRGLSQDALESNDLSA